MRLRCRVIGAALAGLATTGCTFGMMKTDECISAYREGVTIATAQAGPVVEEGYSYCVDGRRRAQAMVPALRAHGFAVEGPDKHFEVPGGWCLSGKRAAAPARYDPMQSLSTMCAIGHAGRAFMTGGSLIAADGKPHYIQSAADRKAREDLDRRLAQDRAK